MLKLDGKTLQYDRAFTHNQISYPANWLRLTTLEEKQAIGIVEVVDNTQSWDQRFYWGVDNPKDLDQLKASYTAEQDYTAGTLLSPSDWRVVKASEVADYLVPSEWLDYRTEVRSVCNTRQAEIDEVTTVEALKELLFGSPTITQQKLDSEGNGVVEPDTITDEAGKEVPNPAAGQPVMETVVNPAIATAWPTSI